MALIYLVYLTVLAGRQWRRYHRGATSRWRALGTYLGLGLLPPLLYTLLFFAAVGVEEWRGTALVTEPFARALPLVVAGGVAATLVSGLILGLLLALADAAANRH